MIKLPKDKYGNVGWVVKARKTHHCEGYRHSAHAIKPGEFYYRAMAWPGTDVNEKGNPPWVLKLCRECLTTGEMVAAFGAIVAKLEAAA